MSKQDLRKYDGSQWVLKIPANPKKPIRKVKLKPDYTLIIEPVTELRIVKVINHRKKKRKR